jgi:hypothetical protein
VSQATEETAANNSEEDKENHASEAVAPPSAHNGTETNGEAKQVLCTFCLNILPRIFIFRSTFVIYIYKLFKRVHSSVADLECLSRNLIFIRPGSRIPDQTTTLKEEGGKFLFVQPIFVATSDKYHKIVKQ